MQALNKPAEFAAPGPPRGQHAEPAEGGAGPLPIDMEQPVAENDICDPIPQQAGKKGPIQRPTFICATPPTVMARLRQ